ncbi:MAG: DNA (cytosine-5-)-methyltransferase [Fulvivirga sp.]|uniref:DNA cytosine methyltransferase n=1 Tax=Fulvivirga sp. TaxID=1931237 RepID=UPI0032F8BBF0
MLKYKKADNNGFSFLGLFTGAGGLDLGFELAGFEHTESNEILDYAVNTLKTNRPNWNVVHGDVREYAPSFRKGLDVLLAGFPCQGFSLGGNRNEADERNSLYKEVIRISKLMQPKVVVMENVLNLRTMKHPVTGISFSQQISNELAAIGYKTKFDFFRVSEHGVPQTRRRFILVASKEIDLDYFQFPVKEQHTPIKEFIYDLGKNISTKLNNHDAQWGFKSYAHKETGKTVSQSDEIVPVRLSRTASDGNPIRSFDVPFPAIDTATVWGWAQGEVKAERIHKDRSGSKYVRNPKSNAKLWRISASRIRSFTPREYARIQTFPDDWVFCGNNKREFQLQIGNAVPVEFARRLALQIKNGLEAFVNGELIKFTEAKQVQIWD